MEEVAGRLPHTFQTIELGRAEGLHVGAQVYASVGDEVVADFAVGLARTAPDVPMRVDTLMLWMSATKPVAAVAVAQLWERGLLDLDDPVARHLPAFAARGKERITLRHLLTHTGGFRALVGKWEDQPWDDIVAAVCDARPEPDWVPGRKAGYHLATSWYVLGEIVRRLDPRGRSFDRYVREEIFEPLGMNDSWVGLPPERYHAYGQRMGSMHETGTGGPTPARNTHPSDSEAGATACRPGSNGRGPVRELGFFYEMLLGRGERNGRRVLSAQSVEALTARHRAGMFDHTFKHVMDWGLGFLINTQGHGSAGATRGADESAGPKDEAPYGYGAHASRRTFGHGGSQCCTAFADPERGLAVAIVWNGRPGEAHHDARLRATLDALYADLGFAE
jgi:CubicO group peptidase (beta-lactamase class C family)